MGLVGLGFKALGVSGFGGFRIARGSRNRPLLLQGSCVYNNLRAQPQVSACKGLPGYFFSPPWLSFLSRVGCWLEALLSRIGKEGSKHALRSSLLLDRTDRITETRPIVPSNIETCDVPTDPMDIRLSRYVCVCVCWLRCRKKVDSTSLEQ